MWNLYWPREKGVSRDHHIMIENRAPPPPPHSGIPLPASSPHYRGRTGTEIYRQGDRGETSILYCIVFIILYIRSTGIEEIPSTAWHTRTWCKLDEISHHRRRIKTDEKAKVVAVVWGTAFIQFNAALAILHQFDLKKAMNLSFSLYRPGAIHPILQIVLVQNSKHGKEMNRFCPPLKQQRRPLPSHLSLSFSHLFHKPDAFVKKTFNSWLFLGSNITYVLVMLQALWLY